MWYIIVGILIIGFLLELLSDLSDLVGGSGKLIVIIIILVASFLVNSWAGVLAVVVGYALIKYVRDLIRQHDKSKKETAKINQKTQADKQIHSNDVALMEELSKNCGYLGYMNDEMWLKKLPNYAGKQYSTDFRTITSNFAKQIEQEYIIQNDDWFKPFKLYILNHPGGSTVTKMLSEVECPQLKRTHSTLDGDLLNTWLVKRTEKANKDVPALFSSTFIKEMNESVFTPTTYLKKLLGGNNEGNQEVNNHATEMNFDDL